MPRAQKSYGEPYKTVGFLLRSYRRAQKLSRKDMAKTLGVHPTQLSRDEMGKSCLPFGRLQAAAKVLGLSLGDFELDPAVLACSGVAPMLRAFTALSASCDRVKVLECAMRLRECELGLGKEKGEQGESGE